MDLVRNRKLIYGAVFLFSLPFALTHYINSSFISAFAGEGSVGIIYTLGSLGSFLTLFLAPRLMKKLGGYRFLVLVVFLNFVYYTLIGVLHNTYAVVAIFIAGFSLNMLIAFILDEFIKIFSKNNIMGSVRGISLVVTHIAFILSQLAFWLVLGSYSFGSIYILSSLVTLLFLLLIFWGLRNVPEPEYDKVSKLKFVGAFFKNRNLLRAYVLSFLLQMFYAWMIIYTPIYLSRHLGFTWNQIGIMFAVMLLPFVLIPYQLGKISDKLGERKILMWGFAITALATLLIFWVDHPGLLTWILLLFLTRIGASMIEVMADAYFFKHIQAENDQYIGVYRGAYPLALIIGPLLASLVFLVVPAFNFLYLVLSAIMLYGVYLSSTIRKSDI
jgi:MFS family permease